MKKLVEMELENLSTKDLFIFRVTCGACGSEYSGNPVRFSKSGIVPQSNEKKIIFNAIYEQELHDAHMAAVREIAQHMNYCPICKRLVCDQCFMICDDLDMCRDCAETLREHGKPVLSRMFNASV